MALPPTLEGQPISGGQSTGRKSSFTMTTFRGSRPGGQGMPPLLLYKKMMYRRVVQLLKRSNFSGQRASSSAVSASYPHFERIGKLYTDLDLYACDRVASATARQGREHSRPRSTSVEDEGRGAGKAYSEQEIALACAALKCALTGKAMRDPVVGPDGYSYERRAAVSHFQRTRRSPVTQQLVPFVEVFPNNQLRNIIEAHKRKVQKVRRRAGAEHKCSAVDYSGDWLRFVQHELKCPITMSRMRDAVVTCDGHSYEREAIVRWLRRHGTSPKSNVELKSKALVTNRNVALLASIVRDDDEDGGEDGQ